MAVLKKCGVSLLIVSVILFAVSALSSCKSGGDKVEEGRISRSHNYSIYTEMLSVYPLGSDYDDIAAYLDEKDVIYTVSESDGAVSRIQLYGGQLFFTSDKKLNSVSSTEWQTPDGFGVGSSISEVRGAVGAEKKLENVAKATYVYKTESGRYTVTFNDEEYVTYWVLS